MLNNMRYNSKTSLFLFYEERILLLSFIFKEMEMKRSISIINMKNKIGKFKFWLRLVSLHPCTIEESHESTSFYALSYYLIFLKNSSSKVHKKN